MIKTTNRKNGTQLTTSPAKKMVAVYTRQSVADDLEFNSIAAQREAVTTYVASQRSQGWEVLDRQYDDHGYSGGTTERPAFQKLLEDVEAGLVDVVAVHRLDRLSRSISDFVRVMDLFNRKKVSFVSTTQSFDSSTSLGRMLINLLATFATYERDLVRERTKEKMVAARKRGLWVGGRPVLGYDLRDKKLVINKKEADLVRQIFRLYLELCSPLAVAKELNRRGMKTKSRKAFDKEAVRRILTNATYVGKVEHDGQLYDGDHQAIIDQETWDAVQRQLRNHKKTRQFTSSRSHGLLAGLLRCGVCGASMTTHSSQRGMRKYCFYVCRTYQAQGAAACPGSRAPIADLEAFIIDQIRAIGKDPRIVAETVKATRRELQTRKPALQEELQELVKQEPKLDAKRRNILDAVAQNGVKSGGLFEKLGEVEAEVDRVLRRTEEIRAEIITLEDQVLDEDDLRQAIAAFDPVWEQLTTAERARIFQLLIEEVRYNAREGEVEIKFRPGGVRIMAREEETA